jgi:hypothetical protein
LQPIFTRVNPLRVGKLIPFRRVLDQTSFAVRTIFADALATRFASIEKAPPKTRELRISRPASAERVTTPLGGLAQLKFVQRARRHAKLQLFRMWKLFGEIKEAPSATVYRPVAERIKEARAMLRL